jgi:hypothetical protein
LKTILVIFLIKIIQTTLERSSVQTSTQAGTKTTTEGLVTTEVSGTSGMSTPVQLSTTTPVGGSSTRSTVEKLSTQTTAVII